MRKKIFAALMIALCVSAIAKVHAQYRFEVREVDFEKIERETLDPNSRYYYPKLVRSFKSNDTIMNFEAYRDLYYGFIFQRTFTTSSRFRVRNVTRLRPMPFRHLMTIASTSSNLTTISMP